MSLLLKLTKRWHPLRAHQVQSHLYHDPARFKLAPAGRRSGKTELSKRKLVLALWDCRIHPRPWDDSRFFAAAPTRDQAKRIFWNDLKKLVPKAWVESISESDLCIKTKWGTELWVLGLDVPERIEGTPWDGGVVDELANCREGTWDAHIRPALADRRGWAWLIGVPDFDGPGQVEYSDMCDIARAKVDDEWRCYEWPSSDILPPEEIESARRRMDPILFDQEFGGKFVKPGGLAFPMFDYATHVRDGIAEYDPAQHLCWCLDFNINPMCSGVIQHHGGIARVIRELTLPDSSTPGACDAFLDLAEREGWDTKNLCIYGDASGDSRSTTTGKSDWTIVRNALRDIPGLTFKVPKSNPAIKDGLNAVRAKLKTAAGEVGLYINSGCRQVIDDLRTLLWPSDLSEGHAAAWLRYFVIREYPVRTDIKVDRSSARVGAVA